MNKITLIIIFLICNLYVHSQTYSTHTYGSIKTTSYIHGTYLKVHVTGVGISGSLTMVGNRVYSSSTVGTVTVNSQYLNGRQIQNSSIRYTKSNYLERKLRKVENKPIISLRTKMKYDVTTRD